MRRFISILSIIFIMSGCANYNYKEHIEHYFKNKTHFCSRLNDQNECKNEGWDDSLFSAINPKNHTWQLITLYGAWSGYLKVFYGKIERNQVDEAISEIINFIRWSHLPADQLLSQKNDYEKNIKLNVIGTEYHIEKGVPYARLKYYPKSYFIPLFVENHYLIDESTAREILINLLLWKKSTENQFQ